MIVVVDVHERPSGIHEKLRERGANVVIEPLPVADYALPAGVLVERKSVTDLHQSIVNGNFWRQIGRLRRATPRPFLLIEGRSLYSGPLADEAVRGLCLAVIERGIRILRSETSADSAAWLHRLALRMQEHAKIDRPTYAQRPRPRSTAEAAEAVLAAMPGVSTQTARALLTHFGTVAAVLTATPEQWLEVPGVGPDRARNIANTLSHPHGPPFRRQP